MLSLSVCVMRFSATAEVPMEGRVHREVEAQMLGQVERWCASSIPTCLRIHSQNKVVQLTKEYLPSTDAYDGDRFFTSSTDGTKLATPLFLALVCVEVSL